MKNISKEIQWLSGFLALLLATQVQAALIMTGSTAFTEASGIFSGTLFAEVSGTAGNYTSTFSLIMDPDSDGSSSSIQLVSFSSWLLGAGTNTGATSGGSTGGDPTLTIFAGSFGNDAEFNFSGLAEGATSTQFWFNHAELGLTGDSLFFGVRDFSGNEAGNVLLTLAPIPLPAAVWLFGSGLLGLASIVRRKKR